MAYENFKPTIWSKFIQHELEKKAILVDSCWRQFQGEVQNGKQVKILGVGKPSIGNYTGASIGSPETIADSSVIMPIDQAKYFNFMVDDVDEAQSVPGLMEALMKEATLEMALAIDSYIATLALNAGTVSAETQVNSADTAIAAIDAGLLKLRENDVQIGDNVVIELPPFVYRYLKDKYIALDTNNSEILKKGIVGMYDNCKVRISNNLHTSGTSYYGMIRTEKAIAFASQIQDVEAYRPETLFSDAVKGLNVFGAKVVRPKELYGLRVKK